MDFLYRALLDLCTEFERDNMLFCSPFTFCAWMGVGVYVQNFTHFILHIWICFEASNPTWLQLRRAFTSFNTTLYGMNIEFLIVNWPLTQARTQQCIFSCGSVLIKCRNDMFEWCKCQCLPTLVLLLSPPVLFAGLISLCVSIWFILSDIWWKLCKNTFHCLRASMFVYCLGRIVVR